MRVESNAFNTLATDRDLHHNEFFLHHFHGNEHLSLSIALTKHGYRSLQLGSWDCQRLGRLLLRFARERTLVQPCHEDDFQI